MRSHTRPKCEAFPIDLLLTKIFRNLAIVLYCDLGSQFAICSDQIGATIRPPFANGTTSSHDMADSVDALLRPGVLLWQSNLAHCTLTAI